MNGRLPTRLDNVQVTIDGKPAVVYFVSNTQLNVQAPPDIGIGNNVPVVVTTSRGTVTTMATVQRLAPAFFVLGNTRAVAARHAGDYAVVGDPAILQGVGPAPARRHRPVIRDGLRTRTARRSCRRCLQQLARTASGGTSYDWRAFHFCQGLPRLSGPVSVQRSGTGGSAERRPRDSGRVWRSAHARQRDNPRAEVKRDQNPSRTPNCICLAVSPPGPSRRNAFGRCSRPRAAMPRSGSSMRVPGLFRLEWFRRLNASARTAISPASPRNGARKRRLKDASKLNNPGP